MGIDINKRQWQRHPPSTSTKTNGWVERIVATGRRDVLFLIFSNTDDEMLVQIFEIFGR